MDDLCLQWGKDAGSGQMQTEKKQGCVGKGKALKGEGIPSIHCRRAGKGSVF